jgi:glycosyltransferase involved in cell wall biosynthesis
MGAERLFSIVIPVYNSEFTLDELVKRVRQVFASPGEAYEIILVDDHSRDASWEVMKRLHREDPRIRIIRLIRNFGQHNAILCGFRYSSGDPVATLDDDLQHPPEEIPRLIQKLDEGYSVVYGRYPPRNTTRFQNLLSSVFQRMAHRILDIPEDLFLSSFVVYRAEVVKKMMAIKTSYPLIFALMSRSTPLSLVANVDVEHHPRKVSRSNYGLLRYFRYSLNLLINYSSLPLTVLGSIGFVVSSGSLLFSLWIAGNKLIRPDFGVEGWNSLIFSITFLNGLILMAIGITGEYLRRILGEISYETPYVIQEMEI